MELKQLNLTPLIMPTIIVGFKYLSFNILKLLSSFRNNDPFVRYSIHMYMLCVITYITRGREHLLLRLFLRLLLYVFNESNRNVFTL